MINDKNKKALKAIGLLAIVAAIAFVGVKQFNKGKDNQPLTMPEKTAYANAIVASGKAANVAALITYEDGYLKAWLDAIKKGQSTFLYNGKTFKTQGGTAA